MDMIDEEKNRCLKFADDNPEIVLPENLDLETMIDETKATNSDFYINGSDGTAGPLMESLVLNTKKSLVACRTHLRLNDRGLLEHSGNGPNWEKLVPK